MARIYVDLDDVLTQTGLMFLRVLEEEFGRRVEFDAIESYHLGESLDLDGGELAEFLRATHEPQRLLSVEPMPGAEPVLAGWLAAGHEVLVVTGRPPATRSATLEWLDRHRMPYSEFHFLDKYSTFYDGAHGVEGTLAMDDLERLELGLAVEDFPGMAEYLAASLAVPVALFDRPWNRRLSESEGEARLVRCRSWDEIGQRFPLDRGPGPV